MVRVGVVRQGEWIKLGKAKRGKVKVRWGKARQTNKGRGSSMGDGVGQVGGCARVHVGIGL